MNSSNKVAKAFPAKRFFVDMLVRDIELQDAILDLLDNCVDGAMRSIEGEAAVTPKKPYVDLKQKLISILLNLPFLTTAVVSPLTWLKLMRFA